MAICLRTGLSDQVTITSPYTEITDESLLVNYLQFLLPIIDRFFPKFRNFLEAMQTLGLTLGLHSEIWEDKENKTHQNLIEEAFELEGVTWISNTRPDRRGGGAAISLLNEDFTITKLDVIIPKNLYSVFCIYSIDHSYTRDGLLHIKSSFKL